MSSSEEDEEEDQVTLEELQKTRPRPTLKGRSSVSAEAYGLWNKKKPYNPKIIQKTGDIKEALKERLNQSFMFKNLEAKDLNIVIDAMEEVKVNANQTVIQQGDDGNVLYFVFSGTLKCSKVYPDKPGPVFLLEYKPGMSFGELALLYNTPRAASIVSNEPCVLYTLDRECFNSIVKESAMKKRKLYDNFLSKVSVLETLDSYERGKICDCLESRVYKTGDYIIREGETGNQLYFIEEGKAYAEKKNSSGGTDRVYDYGAHDYFGEIALIKDVPRQASVVAEVKI